MYLKKSRYENIMNLLITMKMHKITIYKSNTYFLKHLFQASVPFKDNLTSRPITSQCLDHLQGWRIT